MRSPSCQHNTRTRTSTPIHLWSGVTKGMFPPVSTSTTIITMSTGTGHAKYRCGQCEMPEDQCICDKFCCLCQSQLDIRICTDGLMYCDACRHACDYKTSDEH
ncbi:MAG TPA: hypothetical protein VJX47_06310 [Candidatus Sulfotelmatobacter sp.]|nr:hypothetical protein [Candidatus Sulfotelmatobacter sp.]